MSAGVFLNALYVFINPVLWIWPQDLIHIIMDFSLVKHLWKKKKIWHGKYRPDIAHIIYGLEKRACLWGLLWTFHLMWRKTLQSGYIKERWVWGWIQGDKLWMGLKPWLLSVLSQGILGPLQWFCNGAPQNHIQWGQRTSERTSFWFPFNRWALKLSSISWPAYSKNMNGFHQLPALSPSKKTFTVGKTNTDNNYIEFRGFFLSPQNRHLETDHTWTYSVLSCFTFVMLFKIFHKTMLRVMQPLHSILNILK